LAKDLRFALRVICRAPAFSLAVIVAVALAVAAHTAMFSIVNVVLVRPLPFATDLIFVCRAGVVCGEGRPSQRA
jgi:hypothetical protein